MFYLFNSNFIYVVEFERGLIKYLYMNEKMVLGKLINVKLSMRFSL